MDIIEEINAVHREVGERPDRPGARTVLLRRRYDAAVEDVWDAITSPDRIRRWFLPVSGDLRLGGTYQLEGNAGGEIRQCEPPRLLRVTWVFGGAETLETGFSEVEVRLSEGADGQTVFELEHAATVDAERWADYGPGAVGVGWDLTLLGLGLHLRGESIDDPDAWLLSPEAKEFMTGSSKAWGTTPGVTDSMVENTTRFYVPEA